MSSLIIYARRFATIAVVLAGVCSSPGCSERRAPYVYEIPEHYRGWVRIEFEATQCPPLPRRAGKYVAVIPPSGGLCTRSASTYGVATDEYYLVGSERRRIGPSGWGQGGMVWGARLGGQQPGKTVEEFFVGTEAEYNAAKPPAAVTRGERDQR